MKNILLMLLRYVFLCMLLCSLSSVKAQLKHDAIWLFGSPRLTDDFNFGGTQLDFNDNSPELSYFEIPIDLEATSMISDTSGQLVLYTNGCRIVNAQHETIENGDSLNAGRRHDSFCADNRGYPIPQGVITLPKPGTSDKYGLFHLWLNDDFPIFTDIWYTEVDAAANDGAGRVDTLNKIIFQDSLGNNLSAVRHANGRDWWIVTAKWKSNIYYITYYGPDGPGETYAQSIGLVWSDRYAQGQSTFSPNGRKYIRINPDNGLHIFDFDRCAGTLSNDIMIDFPGDTIIATGVAVSPNNRFLYAAASNHIYQFDLEAEDIAASRQTVATYDGFSSPFSTRFYMLMLAPDGKIYGTASAGVNILHIIHQPNLLGEACEVEQHGVDLLTYHSFAVPNFPHFRLWDAAGSPCDTLGIDAPVTPVFTLEEDVKMRVFPNPAADYVSIDFGQMASGLLQLWDVSGRLLLSKLVENERKTSLRLNDIPVGIYFLRFESEQGVAAYRKLVVD